MKNEEHEAMEANESGSTYERLCAYVLGELEGAERAALEAQLAEDADLRAEKERIAATISLVTTTCTGDESLAPEILGALERAAQPAVAPSAPPAPAAQPWYTRAPFQAAAGLAAIVTGVLGGRALWDDAPLSTPGRPSLEELARLEGVTVDRRALPSESEPVLADFDVEIAQGATLGVLGQELNKNEDVFGSADVLVQEPDQESLGFGLEMQAARELDESLAVLAEDARGRNEAGVRVTDLNGFGGGSGNPQFESSFESLAEAPVLTAQDPAGDAARAELREQTRRSLSAGLKPSGGVASSETPIALGGGAGGIAPDASRGVRGYGKYRGPGDTKPPRPGSGGGGGAGGGPATPGPGAPAPPQEVAKAQYGRLADAPTGSDDFFLGKGQAGAADSKKVEVIDELAVLERKRKQSFVGAVSPSGPSSPGPSGPSSPGPSGPSGPSAPSTQAGTPVWSLAPAPATEGGEARVALRAKIADRGIDGGEALDVGALDSLKALGYLDVDADDTAVDFYYKDADAGRRFQLTPEQVDQLCEQRTARILQDCRRLPNERPRDMFFRFWGDNPFELAQLDNQSTFGVDVDTASYALARRYLNDGHLPTKAQIRTEEFLNYFKPDLPAPTEGVFGIHTELAPSRFGNGTDAPSQRWMLRVGVRGKEVAREERKPLALTFVVDTSGSMKEHNRMELVKHALRLLVAQLDAQDSIAIVGFNNSASVILPMTSAQSRGVVEAAIYGLQPDGGTNAEGGLMLGYEVAAQGLTAGAHNRVVLLSDGVANIGQTDQDRINGSVKARRDAGIFLNTIGVGMNNHNDVFLEQLANKGDGICNYVDSSAEARRALVDNFVGAFEAIARDVKIQVEFDRQQVYRYRLLGYENRAIADADFRNDAVDAGEVGSGHQVVALYELELTGAQSTEPLAEVRLRWKAPIGPGRDPLEDTATEVSQPVSLSQGSTYDAATGGYRRSVLVAQFAEILRRSVHARGDSLDELIAESQRLAVQFGDADFAEFVELLHKSRSLIVNHAPQHDDLTNCIDAIRRNRILRAQLDELQRKENQAVVAELQKQNDELEARIRDLIRTQVQEEMK